MIKSGEFLLTYEQDIKTVAANSKSKSKYMKMITSKKKQIKIGYLNSIDILDDYDHLFDNQQRLYSCECYSEKGSVMLLKFEELQKLLSMFKDNQELFRSLAMSKF